MSHPRIRLAMLTYGALDATQRCIRSLEQHTDQPFELYVVDNASTDGTPQWLDAQTRDWLHVRHNSHNRGVPGGRNDLLDFILPDCDDGDWIVFVDNDLEFGQEWLAPFRRAIEQHQTAGIFGKVGHFIQVRGNSRVLFPAPTKTSHVDVVSGGFACFVRADAARQIGAFDEQLGTFWHEDDDYCLRALQHGFDVVAVPEAAIEHHEHASGVATPDLDDGGSPTNQTYLATKWRDAKLVDRDGWIVRQNGPYLSPTVRDELAKRSECRGAIGRTDLAAAISLLEQMLEQSHPMRWFDTHRQPVPACLRALIALHREHTVPLGDPELTSRLDAIDAALSCASNTAVLTPMLRTPGVDNAAPAGSGVCRSSDFESPEFHAVGGELGIGTLIRDPHARTLGQWEMLAAAAQLRRADLPRANTRVLVTGKVEPQVLAWLQQGGSQIEYVEPHQPHRGRYDAVLCWHDLDRDRIRDLLAAHADSDTRAVFVGNAALNGVPGDKALLPHQLELDLLARTGLQSVSGIAQHPDDAVLEAYAAEGVTNQSPQLCRLAGSHLITSFVVAAVRQPVQRPAIVQTAVPASRTTTTIGVDLRTLFHADSVARGIGKYTTQHLAALCDVDPGLRIIGYAYDDHRGLPCLLQRRQISLRSIDDYRADDVDLVHIPDPLNMTYGFDAPLRVMRHERTTVTFHDLTPLHHYIDKWPRRNRDSYLDRLRQLERSDCQLLCNSQFTARDLLAHSSISPDRVTPILAGLHHDGGTTPDAQTIADVRKQLGIDGPFVLHVGALDPHKNFHAALNAYLLARSQQSQHEPPLQFVVVGAVDPGITQAAQLCATRHVPGVTFTGYLPRQHLDALYASTTALLFLSRAEGFGLPILEAMAKGCPVVASNATSHPEVANGAALLVEPDDQHGAARHLRELMQNPTLAVDLRLRGQRQSTTFRWRDVAERTRSAWHGLMGEAPIPDAAEHEAPMATI